MKEKRMRKVIVALGSELMADYIATVSQQLGASKDALVSKANGDKGCFRFWYMFEGRKYILTILKHHGEHMRGRRCNILFYSPSIPINELDEIFMPLLSSSPNMKVKIDTGGGIDIVQCMKDVT